ncbi:hypothetical protein DFH28DRAFT_1080229 [Melampsora americana]|nr:hypothetical protein DFH28DRAFT_1080229 [Melampsora americana]
MRSPPIHPQSCVECLNSNGRTCSWEVHESLPITSTQKCDMCLKYKEKICTWPEVYETINGEIQVQVVSDEYKPGPKFETAAHRLRRVKAWTSAPSRPTNPEHVVFWRNDLKLWNNGGNSPLPPQIPVNPKASTSAPPPKVFTSQPKPPPIPTQPRAFNTKPKPKPPSPFMPKRPTPAPPPPAPKVPTPEPGTPPPPSPPAIPSATIVDLVETPPPSPVAPQPASPPAIPSHPDPSTPQPTANSSTAVPEPHISSPSLNPTSRQHIEDFIRMYGEKGGKDMWFARKIKEADLINELGGIPHHLDPRDPTIALTEAMFSLLSVHWKIFKTSHADELLAREILATQMKNLVAQDMLY